MLGGTRPAGPATVYLALFTTNPDNTGSGAVEATGTAYARKSITADTTNFPAAVSASGTTTISNGVDIAMATVGSGGWGACVGWGLYDASTSGNLLYFSALDSTYNTTAGDVPTFVAGSLVVKVT